MKKTTLLGAAGAAALGTVALLMQTQQTAVVEASLFHDGFDSACWMAGKEWLKTASPSYGVYPQQRPNLDITLWDNVWGYNNTTSPRKGWPGVGGAAPVFKNVKPNVFTCSKFTTPANIASYNGNFSNPSYIAGPNVTMDIVAANGLMDTPGCIAANVPTSDANLVQWKGTPNAPGSWCNLKPNTTYYVREYITDGQCTPPHCIIGSVSYHNGAGQ